LIDILVDIQKHNKSYKMS